jgi:hypothetical protein
MMCGSNGLTLRRLPLKLLITLNKETVMQTVDLTPTWSDILPAMLAVLDNKEAPASSHEFIRSELENMAKVADKWVAHIKEGHEKWLAEREGK